MTKNQEIAKAILQQLGGNKFLAMTGSKNLAAIENGLQMRLTKNSAKAKFLKITLNGLDLYDMEFVKEKRQKNQMLSELLGKAHYETVGFETVKKYNGVYDDMLQSIFTEATGLYTKF